MKDLLSKGSLDKFLCDVMDAIWNLELIWSSFGAFGPLLAGQGAQQTNGSVEQERTRTRRLFIVQLDFILKVIIS